MKKWLRRALIAALLIGLTLGVLYEVATHVGRGWLYGEAFYEGRPTSYWRLRCDEWLDRFNDADSLTQITWMLPVEIPGQKGFCGFGIPDDLPMKGGSVALPRETVWKRIRDSVRSKEDLERERFYHFAPKILWGTPDTEPVLEALALDEKYHWLATLALRRVMNYRELEIRFATEALE